MKPPVAVSQLLRNDTKSKKEKGKRGGKGFKRKGKGGIVSKCNKIISFNAINNAPQKTHKLSFYLRFLRELIRSLPCASQARRKATF